MEVNGNNIVNLRRTHLRALEIRVDSNCKRTDIIARSIPRSISGNIRGMHMHISRTGQRIAMHSLHVWTDRTDAVFAQFYGASSEQDITIMQAATGDHARR